MAPKNTSFLPLARTADLVAETIGTETVVYDGVSKDAHYLTPLASAVFAAADGRTPVARIVSAVSDELGETADLTTVEQALAELEERDLIVIQDGGGVSRRDMLRRGALVGGAALAAPLVVSLATPEYGQAGSLSSLSYVVLVFKDSTNTYYRAKWQGGSAIWGWGFATPGTGCTFAKPSKTSDGQVAGLSVVETANGGGDTQITISWTAAMTLVDVRIKCATTCHVVSSPKSTTPSGPYVGCP